MRQPRPSEVIDAVQYVTGADPVAPGREPSVIKARRLAVQALTEITELSQTEVGEWLGMDRSTVSYHLYQPCDYDALGMVVKEVSAMVNMDEPGSARWQLERKAQR